MEGGTEWQPHQNYPRAHANTSRHCHPSSVCPCGLPSQQVATCAFAQTHTHRYTKLITIINHNNNYNGWILFKWKYEVVFLKKKKTNTDTYTQANTHTHLCTMPSGPRDNSNGISRLIDGSCPLVNFKCQMNPKQENPKCRYYACVTLTSQPSPPLPTAKTHILRHRVRLLTEAVTVLAYLVFRLMGWKRCVFG